MNPTSLQPESLTLSGVLLDQSLPGGREAAVLIFSKDAIKLGVPDQPHLARTLGKEGLKFTRGGSNNSLIFVEHFSLGSGRIFFDYNRKTVSELLRLGLLRDKTEVASLTHSHDWAVRGFAFAVLAILAVLVIFRGPIFGSMSNLVSFEREKQLADKVFKADSPTEAQKPVREEFVKLVGNFYQAFPEWKDRFTVHLVSESERNAYATLGGHIFVNSGLIEELKTPEDLLGVLAHETVHSQNRHVLRSIFTSTGLFLTIQVLLGDVSGIAAVLAENGSPLLTLSYSRELEQEADKIAVDWLVQAGIDPKGLPDSLKAIYDYQMKKMENVPGGEVLKEVQKVELLSTHPEMEKRISTLRTLIAEKTKGKTFKKIDFDYSKFQEQIRKYY